MYVLLDSICMGPIELSGAHIKRKLQNEKYLSIVEFKPTPAALKPTPAAPASEFTALSTLSAIGCYKWKIYMYIFDKNAIKCLYVKHDL